MRLITVVLVLSNLTLVHASPVDNTGLAQDFSKHSVPKLKKLQSQWHQSLKKTIGLACETDDHCKSIAVGINPCGGAASYKIYSTAATDEIRLKELALKYNKLSGYLNKKLGRIGACVFLEAPIVHCKNNKCVSKNFVLK